ncbi:KCTD4 [Branchiostoma lanceolatum]|uniref:KCTD4 protein n=1 Tax=Branchiostoma lanceolatum TaxID=7740 RepID=A0A8J9YQU8_BRALA|nr:KCTD4 [Branchiostoma lanceolatum]
MYRQAPSVQCSPDIVALNVGGHFYTTTRSTLTKYDSRLSAMFGHSQSGYNVTSVDILRDERGRYFIDRDGMVFRHVLNFLRLGELVLPEGFKELCLLEKEATFYQIRDLIRAVRTKMDKYPLDDDDDHYGYDYGYD